MKLEQLTFTRYLAALTVLFFHFGGTVFPASVDWLAPIFMSGPTAVTYFYLLSGFIMAIAYYRPETTANAGRFKTGKYWLARFARVYPIYLLVLLLMIVANFDTDGKDPVAVLLNLLVLQAWVPGYALSINSPGWSISVEAFFYLIFPLLMMVQHRHMKRLLWLTLILWAVTQLIQIGLHNLPAYKPHTLLHDFIYYFPLMHLNLFLSGFLAGVWFVDGKLNHLAQNRNGLALFLCTLTILLLLVFETWIEARLGFLIDYNNGLLSPLFILLMVLIAQNRGRLTQLFAHPLPILLGEASYSLYLLQRPFYAVYDRTLGQWLPLGQQLHFYLFVVLLTITAIISFKLIETPLRRYINGFYASSGKTGTASG
ncbi:MAG: acyltransferase [Thiothrix sp.]|nr:acyltransferase [Thiothrix sp.]HPQ95003.1 acyltransferase [Thiolinea sp.]